MSRGKIISNPDLTVGADNKQRWNQPAHRRHGFHNAHRLFRRGLMVRSREVLVLGSAEQDLCAAVPGLADLIFHPAFSAFCCLKGDQIIMEKAAEDFSTTTRPGPIMYGDPISRSASPSLRLLSFGITSGL